ncbi:MAG: hypothetical protein CM15mV126_400 [uncultured marine virus]|nr:MAG: hypothetical protein CM15mV126_400 [uncultured marine virus]
MGSPRTSRVMKTVMRIERTFASVEKFQLKMYRPKQNNPKKLMISIHFFEDGGLNFGIKPFEN